MNCALGYTRKIIYKMELHPVQFVKFQDVDVSQ